MIVSTSSKKVCLIMFNLFDLRFTVPFNIFSVISGRRHRVLGINRDFGELMLLVQGHNAIPRVGIELKTSQFKARCSATSQLPSPFKESVILKYYFIAVFLCCYIPLQYDSTFQFSFAYFFLKIEIEDTTHTHTIHNSWLTSRFTLNSQVIGRRSL